MIYDNAEVFGNARVYGNEVLCSRYKFASRERVKKWLELEKSFET